MSAVATPLATPAANGQLFANDAADRSLFGSHFDFKPFEFRHLLHRQEIFQLPALMELAARLSAKKDQKSHYESGTPDVNGYFGQRPQDQTMVQALESIRDGKNWVILKRIHEDPLYGQALESLIPELSALSGVDMKDVYYDPTLTVFITSPGRITPYHMDGETNFLAQIHGTKMVYIYDGHDKSILSNTDLENYWTGNLPKINLPAALPEGTWQWQLKPGNGVFNPAIFPHWLQNGPDVSVSVSINFKRKQNSIIGAHRTNHFARKLGLNPSEPGKSPAIDRLKTMTFGNLYETAHATRTKVRQRFGI
ncbi:hypothetical protein SAMN05421770_105266 [Granulicella rosea]|uniref:JmjC domain-containing protein n=1 Tax=Granulicella rosea TaxID=474952 RepID=A0A239KWW6_9BACT|nr:hypothetical protein [Granulicella rosea]SNT22500.1 hypothetical protein SAMN05421770_105266 [Granulicella rosea]